VRDNVVGAQWAVSRAPHLLDATVSHVDLQLRAAQDRDIERIVRTGYRWGSWMINTAGLTCNSSDPFDTVFIEAINKACDKLESVGKDEAVSEVLAAGRCARDILVSYYRRVCAIHVTISVQSPTPLRTTLVAAESHDLTQLRSESMVMVADDFGDAVALQREASQFSVLPAITSSAEVGKIVRELLRPQRRRDGTACNGGPGGVQ
jgi:hypothetical protein